MGAHGLSIPTRQTLGDYWDEWWKTESPLWARSTRIQRKSVSDRWIKKQLGGVRPRDLGTKRVREWRGEIASAGASPTQANYALSILSAALGCAVRDNALPSNPCSGVRKLPVMVARPRALTPSEIESIMARMPKQRDRLLVALMGYCGLRPSEAIGLAWDRRPRPSPDR
jgi:integrase